MINHMSLVGFEWMTGLEASVQFFCLTLVNLKWFFMDNAKMGVRIMCVLFNCVEYAFLGWVPYMLEFLDEFWGRLMMNLSFLLIDFGRMNIEWNVFVFGFEN